MGYAPAMRPGRPSPRSWRRPAAALLLWLLAVALHGPAQEAFAWGARAWGFSALQRGQAWAWAVVAPLAVGGAMSLAWRRRGIRPVAAVLGVALLDLAGARLFVTHAEALHYPLYAAIAGLAGPTVWAFLAVCTGGVVDELLQWAWLDTARAGAGPDAKDMLLNVLGAATGAVWVRAAGGGEARDQGRSAPDGGRPAG